ncbi:MAG: glycosyltransferase [Gammaproteobacteria bacterium]|nr:glycosyltransferase [Gammaproteobacteria bacterium]NIR83932.1 glycosyltransferase [Gammaproteobacteria bacterium]NIR88975.1 glycosyltransferase [Gammaproteobacteria bacterium]NIV74528.1 glycosyltransferase [Gammaproteobacteria bacterium]
MDVSADIVIDLLLGGSLVGILYLIAAVGAVRAFRVRGPRAPSSPHAPPVTILKPVCGDEPGLYENLRSFCEQDYPTVQVVFGARHSGDSALPVVRRLMRDLPDADLSVVVAGGTRGANQKVGNLANMMSVVRHDVLVIADSDMRVRPDYLTAVVSPLGDPRVGLVTCLYVGRPVRGLWAALGAMSINYGFVPLVLVGRLIGAMEGCFGATIVLRREVLDRIGGFAPFSNQLADDFALGEAVRALGWRAELSRYVVDNLVSESEFRQLLQHELRWARTIRAITPFGYACSVITLPLGLSLLAVALSWGSAEAVTVFLIAYICRLILVRVIERTFGLDAESSWWVPVRDLLSLVVFAVSFCGKKVVWRDRELRTGSDGRLFAGRSSR